MKEDAKKSKLEYSHQKRPAISAGAKKSLSDLKPPQVLQENINAKTEY